MRVTALRDRLWEGIRARVPDVRLNGHPDRAAARDGEHLATGTWSRNPIVLGLDLKGIGVSAGSACTSGNVEPSYVLVAMGVPLDWAMGAVRRSLGRSTTAEDIDYVIESVEPTRAQAARGDAGGRRVRYSPTLLEHFLNPRNAGLMREPDGVGRRGVRGLRRPRALLPARAGRPRERGAVSDLRLRPHHRGRQRRQRARDRTRGGGAC